MAAIVPLLLERRKGDAGVQAPPPLQQRKTRELDRCSRARIDVLVTPCVIAALRKWQGLADMVIASLREWSSGKAGTSQVTFLKDTQINLSKSPSLAAFHHALLVNLSRN